MPTLPQYEQQRNIEAKQAAPYAQGEFSGFAKANEKVVNTMSKIAAAWSEAHDQIQTTKSKAKHGELIAQIQKDALLDKNYENSEKYYQDLERAKQVSLEGIDNKMVAEQLGIELGYQNDIARIKIETDFKQKELAANDANLDAYVQSQVKKLDGATDAYKMQVQDDTFMELDDQISKGLITAERAKELMTAFHVSAIQEEIYADKSVSEEDSDVLKELQKKKGGKYGFLDPDIKTQLVVKSQNRIQQNIDNYNKEVKQAQFVMKETQDYNHAQYLTNLSDQVFYGLTAEQREAEIQKIDAMVIAGTFDEDMGAAAKNMLSNPKSFDHLLSKGTKANIAKYKNIASYAESVLSIEDPEARKKATIAMMNAVANGENNFEEIGVILKVAYEMGQDPRINFMQHTVERFINSDVFENRVKHERLSADHMTANFLKGIVAGYDPRKAKDDAIEQEQIRMNTDRAKYKIGEAVETATGTQYIWGFFPNGEADVYPNQPPKGWEGF